MRIQHDRVPVIQVDEQLSVEHEEELVGLVVLVPVKLAFDDAETDDRVIDGRQGLVEPRLMRGCLVNKVDQERATCIVGAFFRGLGETV